MPMSVVNARVDAGDVNAARRVLEREGLTVSWAIRTTIEYIARMGTLPDLEVNDEGESLSATRQAIDFFEALPVADPPAGWGDVTLDRQMIEDERRGRLGQETQVAGRYQRPH